MENPEAIFDVLSMRSMRERYNNNNRATIIAPTRNFTHFPTVTAVNVQQANEDSLEDLVRDFTIDDSISDCFAESDLDTSMVNDRESPFISRISNARLQTTDDTSYINKSFSTLQVPEIAEKQPETAKNRTENPKTKTSAETTTHPTKTTTFTNSECKHYKQNKQNQCDVPKTKMPAFNRNAAPSQPIRGLTIIHQLSSIKNAFSNQYSEDQSTVMQLTDSPDYKNTDDRTNEQKLTKDNYDKSSSLAFNQILQTTFGRNVDRNVLHREIKLHDGAKYRTKNWNKSLQSSPKQNNHRVKFNIPFSGIATNKRNITVQATNHRKNLSDVKEVQTTTSGSLNDNTKSVAKPQSSQTFETSSSPEYDELVFGSEELKSDLKETKNNESSPVYENTETNFVNQCESFGAKVAQNITAHGGNHKDAEMFTFDSDGDIDTAEITEPHNLNQGNEFSLSNKDIKNGNCVCRDHAPEYDLDFWSEYQNESSGSGSKVTLEKVEVISSRMVCEELLKKCCLLDRHRRRMVNREHPEKSTTTPSSVPSEEHHQQLSYDITDEDESINYSPILRSLIEKAKTIITQDQHPHDTARHVLSHVINSYIEEQLASEGTDNISKDPSHTDDILVKIGTPKHHPNAHGCKNIEDGRHPLPVKTVDKFETNVNNSTETTRGDVETHFKKYPGTNNNSLPITPVTKSGSKDEQTEPRDPIASLYKHETDGSVSLSSGNRISSSRSCNSATLTNVTSSSGESITNNHILPPQRKFYFSDKQNKRRNKVNQGLQRRSQSVGGLGHVTGSIDLFNDSTSGGEDEHRSDSRIEYQPGSRSRPRARSKSQSSRSSRTQRKQNSSYRFKRHSSCHSCLCEERRERNRSSRDEDPILLHKSSFSRGRIGRSRGGKPALNEKQRTLQCRESRRSSSRKREDGFHEHRNVSHRCANPQSSGKPDHAKYSNSRRDFVNSEDDSTTLFDEEDDDVDDDNDETEADESPVVRVNVPSENLSDDALRIQRLKRHLQSVHQLRQRNNDVIETVVTGTGERLAPNRMSRDRHDVDRKHVNIGVAYPFRSETNQKNLSYARNAEVAIEKTGMRAATTKKQQKVKKSISSHLFNHERSEQSGIPHVHVRELTESEFEETFDRRNDVTVRRRREMDAGIPWDQLEFSSRESDVTLTDWSDGEK